VDVNTDKTVRRNRKAPARRVPAAITQPESKPLAFGWGADLNRRERESVKERIALIAGIALASVLVLLLAWGWYRDNISGPADARAQAAKPVAQVGNNLIRMGFFKRFEKFQQTQLNQRVQQGQQQLATIPNTPKDAAVRAQLQNQLTSIQSQLGSLPTSTLTSLINYQIVLQRSYTLGYPNTPKVGEAQMSTLMKQAGGPLHLNQFITQSGLSRTELRDLLTAQFLQGKLASKLAKQTPRTQFEVHAEHILLPAKQKAVAEKVYQQVLQGGNFAQLAKKYSKDTTSAVKGGDLGYFPRGQTVAPFDKAAFSMKRGQVRLVKSQFGWHILKVLGHKSIHLTPPQYQQAQQTAYSTWLNTQQGILHIQRFVAPASLPNPVSPATSAGSVPNQVPAPVPQQAPPAVVHTTKKPAQTGKKP